MIEPTQPGRGRGFLGLAALAALAAFLMLAPLASAASDPLAGGTTTIKLGKGFANKLSKSGIKVTGSAPTTAKGGSIVLPVLSGSIDPIGGQGSLAHSGGFKFKRGSKSASVRELSLETATGALNAVVAGKKMKFASAGGFGVSRDGFGIDLKVGSLKLTSGAAKALNKKLVPPAKKAPKGKRKGKASASKGKKPPFKAEMSIGESLSDTEPATVSVVGAGVTQLVVNEAESEAYKTAESRPIPTPPATIGTADIPPLFFPLSGGTVAPNGLTGQIQTAGAVAFGQEPESGLQIAVVFTEFTIDFTAKTVTAELSVESNDQEKLPTPGKLGRRVVADLDIGGAVIKPDPAARTISYEGIRTVIRADLAELMNSTYKKDAFKAGDSLGTFSYVAQTQ